MSRGFLFEPVPRPLVAWVVPVRGRAPLCRGLNSMAKGKVKWFNDAKGLALSRRSRVQTCSSTSQRSRRRGSVASPRATTSSSTSPRVQRGCRHRTFARSELAERSQTGPGHTGPVCFSYIGPMTPAILLLVLLQAPQGATAPPRPFAYRGFAPGMAYRDFASRARSIAQGDSDILACQTMHNTAQVMDCGVRVRDPVDSARFYLSANVIESRTSVIAFVDSGKVALVRRTQDEHAQAPRYAAAPRAQHVGMDQGATVHPAQLAGRPEWRVISITLNDRDVLARNRPLSTCVAAGTRGRPRSPSSER